MKKILLISVLLVSLVSFAQIPHSYIVRNAGAVSQPFRVDSTHYRFVVNVICSDSTEIYKDFWYQYSINNVVFADSCSTQTIQKIINDSAYYSVKRKYPTYISK